MSVGNRLQRPPSLNNLEPLYDAAVLSKGRSGTDLIKPSGSFSKKPPASLTLGESPGLRLQGSQVIAVPIPKPNQTKQTT